MQIKLKYTPFATWMENGEPDPFDGYYDNDTYKSKGTQTNAEVAGNLLTMGGFTKIYSLTIAKERLRWLSRRLFILSNNDKKINEERYSMPHGELTDYILANEFYLQETQDLIEAGYERILWLDSKIKEFEDKDNA